MADAAAPDVAAPDVAATATRRCWRCLQMFGCRPDEVSRHAEWWLCDPCHESLLGGERRRRT